MRSARAKATTRCVTRAGCWAAPGSRRSSRIIGNGVFDGAHLVQNFESLNPANTFWDKYYHLFANVDTEQPRFLEFERWWGGFYLMNRDEIEWITRNLFVGNQLWSERSGSGARALFDLREIRSPIILFASMGDNITPPQQAFNWVADVYGSTEEIKARGQTIVGLLHKEIGHLGIFVSGKVAKKEHAQIVSVLKSIEALPPGLYGMEIVEEKDADGKPVYNVRFHERQLEEVVQRLNRFKRADEKPFEAVAAMSEFNQRAYELFAQPLVQAMSNEYTAKLSRTLHPLRASRWAWSDLNPWLAWLGPAAAAVKAQRASVAADDPLRKLEKRGAELLSASLDYYRDVRDAASEASFFQLYGNLFSLYVADKHEAEASQTRCAGDRPARAAVCQGGARLDRGGRLSGGAGRCAYLLQRKGEPLPLARLELKQDLMTDYGELIPQVAPDERRRIRGAQEIIVNYEPERAIETLPGLVADPADRSRLVNLLERVLADERIQRQGATSEQLAMLARIEKALGMSVSSAATSIKRAA